MNKVVSDAKKKWLVIYTKPRTEKKVDAALLCKNIESWCPLNKVQKQWSDRKKIVEEPLFKSYVFVRINESEKLAVLTTPGVLNFVYYLSQPAVIRNEEVENIKKYLMLEDAQVSLITAEGFKPNTKVKISHGVFLDAYGTVIKGNAKKVYVQIESLGQLMVVEFKTQHLQPLLQ